MIQRRRMCCAKLATSGNPSQSPSLCRRFNYSPPSTSSRGPPLSTPAYSHQPRAATVRSRYPSRGFHFAPTKSFPLYQRIFNQQPKVDGGLGLPKHALSCEVPACLESESRCESRLPPRQDWSRPTEYTMPLYIRAATEADTARLGRIGRDAFRDSLSRSFFPAHLSSKSETGDPDQDEAQWRGERVMRRMREGKPTFVVVDVPDDGSDGENVVGFAQWELPSSSRHVSEPAHESESDSLPASLDIEALKEVFAKLEAEAKKALGPDGHSKIWCKVRPQIPMLYLS